MPGIGERHGGPGQIVGADLADADPADQVLVGQPEGPEVEGVDVTDHRHHEGPGAVRLLEVDGDPKADVLMMHDRRRRFGVVPAGRHEAGVQHGHRRQGLAHGVADEMGEAHLAGCPAAAQFLVEQAAVDLQEPGRDDPEAGGGGDAQTGLHVGDDPSGGAADRRPHRRGGGRRCRGRLRALRAGRSPAILNGPRRVPLRFGGVGGWREGGTSQVGPSGAVPLEEVAPAGAHRLGVPPVLLVHLVHEPGIGSEDV